jgi:hypothetical protein
MTTLLDNAAVPMKNDQIIRVPDDLRWPMACTAGLFRVPFRPGWESGLDVRFESM